MHRPKTALVTGASSGLGLEAAAQLAEAGCSRIILAARTQAKGEAARAALVARVGAAPYEVVVMDLDDPESIDAATQRLLARGERIDTVLLNAGLVSGSEIVRTRGGVEITVAGSLTGHHALVTRLLAADLLAPDARIVISGSEAARGDLPMMGPTDVVRFAREHCAGDRVRAIRTIARAEAPYAYKNMPHYAMAKVFVAWWAAALARRLPSGITVCAVSPGNSPDTNAMRNQSWIMRFVMGWVLGTFGRLLGLAHPVSRGAARYLEGVRRGADWNGAFYASPAGRVTGPLERQRQPHLIDEESQEALWQAVVELTGADLPARRSVAI